MAAAGEAQARTVPLVEPGVQTRCTITAATEAVQAATYPVVPGAQEAQAEQAEAVGQEPLAASAVQAAVPRMAEQPETTHPAEREAQTAPPLNLEGPRLARLLMAAMVQATPTVPLVVAAADRTARE